MSRYIAYVAWVALVGSICLWGGVFYAYQWIQNEARIRGANVKSVEQRADEAANVSRTRSLAQETAVEREQLESASRADIVDIASEIESAGRSVGVVARVNNASPASGQLELPGGAPLSSIVFIIQADGSFAGVAQFMRVLEHFPGFATVEQFDLDRIPTTENAAQSWRASVRLTIRTTSDISS